MYFIVPEGGVRLRGLPTGSLSVKHSVKKYIVCGYKYDNDYAQIDVLCMYYVC